MEKLNSADENRLLIIGGSGFIGAQISKKALNLGFHVSILSKNYKPTSKRITAVDYYIADISRQKELSSKIQNKIFHYVINLGGYINHSNYFDCGDKVVDAHFNGIKNIVNCIDRSNLISFVQIGSSDEYGNNPAPQGEKLRELPISPYAFAKTASTHFLQMLHLTENFPSVILRPFLVYGPGQEINRFIPQIINGCLNDSEFSVSHGDQLRDFCFIDDIVDAIFLTLNNSNIHGEVINIASGTAVSIKEVVVLIQKIIGTGSPKFGQIPYRAGENMALYAETSKAINLLNWSSKITLEEGLKRTIEFQKNHLLVNPKIK
jgi:nucleoside-diphosphate-sugar epimerase